MRSGHSNIHNIIIIDDNHLIRFVIKHIFYNTFSSKYYQIYSSADGLDALAYLYITNPDIVILDTSLPRYGGLEIIDYIHSNKDLNSKFKKVIVLAQSHDKLPDLPEKYTVIFKDNPEFLKKLIHEFEFITKTKSPGAFARFRQKAMLGIGYYLLNYANKADRNAISADETSNIILKLFFQTNWFIVQLISSFFLSLFYLFASRHDKDLNLPQHKKDLWVSRIRTYPALAILLASIVIITIQALLAIGSSLGFFQIVSKHVLAASYSWDGGGTTNNWSDCDNWSSDTCPLAVDGVTFDATSSKPVVIDAAASDTIASITINSSYSGNISQERSLIVTGNFTQSGGIFTANSQTLDINGAFTLNSGADFAASSGSTYVAGAFTINGGTFNHNNGIITFDGSTQATLSCNNISFNLVTFNPVSAIVKTVNNNCTLPLGNNPTITPNFNIALYGTLSGSGTFTKTQGVIYMRTGGNFYGFSGLALPAFVTESGSDVNLSSFSTFSTSATMTVQTGSQITLPPGADLNDSLTITGGTFNGPVGYMYIGRNLTISGTPTINFANTTIVLDGSAGGTWACNNTIFGEVGFANTGSRTINSDCSLPLGAYPEYTASGTIVLNGALSGSGTLTKNGAITMNSGASITGFNRLNVTTLTVSGANADFSGLIAFTTSSTVTLSSGSLTLPNGADLNGSLTITGGTFNAPSGTMTLGQSLTISGSPIFNHNNGLIDFDFTSGTLSCNNVTFNLVDISHTVGTKTINSNCSLPLGNNPDLTATTSITLNGTLSGTGTLTKGAGLTMNTGSSIQGFNSLSLSTFTIAGATADFSNLASFVTTAGTLSITSGSLSLPPGADINGSLSISGGTFTAPAGNLFLATALTISGSGNYVHNNGTLVLDGLNTATLTCNNKVFNLVRFEHTNGTKTVSSSCTFPLGADPVIQSASGAGITVQGSLTGTGNLTSGMTMTLNSASALSGFGPRLTNTASLIMSANSNLNNFTELVVGSLQVSGGNVNLSSFTLVDINVTFSMSSGTFTAPASMDISRHFTFSGGTFNHNNGVINFVAENNLSSTLTCANVVFNKVTFTKDDTLTINSPCVIPLGANPVMNVTTTNLSGSLSGTGKLTLTGPSTFTLNSGASISGFDELEISADKTLVLNGANFDSSSYSTVDINGNLTLTNGTFTAPASVNLGGNLSVGNGVFNHNNGSLILDGDNQILSGNITFYNLTKNSDSGSSLTFPAGNTISITNEITLMGTNAQALQLISSTANSQWQIDPQGTRNIEYVSVSDSNNINAAVIQLHGTGTNLGNNTNWNFGTPTANNLGPELFVQNGISQNNQPSLNFSVTDVDTGDTLIYVIEIANNANFTSPVVSYTSSVQVQGNKTFTVGQSPLSGNYIAGSEGQKLSDGHYYWRVAGIDNTNHPPVYNAANNSNVAFSVDTTPPTGNINIVENTDNSNPWAVTLELTAIDALTSVTQMQISENSSFAESTWEQFVSTKNYSFSETSGLKTVYVRFSDAAGNISPAYSDTLLVLTTNTVIPTAVPTITSIPTLVPTLAPEGNEGNENDDPEITLESYTLKFKVVDKLNRPVVGVQVTLYSEPMSAVTDSDGIASFTNVKPGEHRLVINYADRVDERIINVSGSQENIEIKFIIEHQENSSYLIYILILSVVIVLLSIYVIYSKKMPKVAFSLRKATTLI